MAFYRVGRRLRLGKQRKLRRFSIVPLHQTQICETTLATKAWAADLAKRTFIYRPAGTLNGRRAVTSPHPLVPAGFSGMGWRPRLGLVSPCISTKFEAAAPGLTIEWLRPRALFIKRPSLRSDLRAPIPRGAVLGPIRAHIERTASAFGALEMPARCRNFDGVRPAECIDNSLSPAAAFQIN
jgi:hypothetical protein